MDEIIVDEMIVAPAKANFCLFRGPVPAEVATERVESSSLGVVGWASEKVMDWEDVGKTELSDKLEHAKPNTQHAAPGWESLIHIFEKKHAEMQAAGQQHTASDVVEAIRRDFAPSASDSGLGKIASCSSHGFGNVGSDRPLGVHQSVAG